MKQYFLKQTTNYQAKNKAESEIQELLRKYDCMIIHSPMHLKNWAGFVQIQVDRVNAAHPRCMDYKMSYKEYSKGIFALTITSERGTDTNVVDYSMTLIKSYISPIFDNEGVYALECNSEDAGHAISEAYYYKKSLPGCAYIDLHIDGFIMSLYGDENAEKLTANYQEYLSSKQ